MASLAPSATLQAAWVPYCGRRRRFGWSCAQCRLAASTRAPPCQWARRATALPWTCARTCTCQSYLLATSSRSGNIALRATRKLAQLRDSCAHEVAGAPPRSPASQVTLWAGKQRLINAGRGGALAVGKSKEREVRLPQRTTICLRPLLRRFGWLRVACSARCRWAPECSTSALLR